VLSHTGEVRLEIKHRRSHRRRVVGRSQVH
jgi:hypothetical protein